MDINAKPDEPVILDEKKTIKVKKILLKKDDRYKDKQLEIVNKILKILDPINSKFFVLHDIDNNEGIKSQIMATYPEIQIYFAVSRLTTNMNNNPVSQRPWLSIVKAILKKTGYKLAIERLHIKPEPNKIIHTQKYVVYK